MAAKSREFDYTVHAVSKAEGRSRWTSCGVAFINERADPDTGEVTQSVTLKLNAGLSIHTSECDIVLLPFKAKAPAAAG